MITDSVHQQVSILDKQSTKDTGLSLSEKLKQDELKDKEALRTARKWFQGCLLALLSTEIVFLIYIILSQAIKRLLFTHIPFELDNWEFVPFVNIALVQTCILIRPIAKDLFPARK